MYEKFGSGYVSYQKSIGNKEHQDVSAYFGDDLVQGAFLVYPTNVIGPSYSFSVYIETYDEFYFEAGLYSSVGVFGFVGFIIMIVGLVKRFKNYKD